MQEMYAVRSARSSKWPTSSISLTHGRGFPSPGSSGRATFRYVVRTQVQLSACVARHYLSTRGHFNGRPDSRARMREAIVMWQDITDSSPTNGMPSTHLAEDARA